MNKFDLRNFITETESKSKDDQYPSWYEELTPNKKIIFHVALELFKSIQADIEAGNKLSINNRRIILDKVAKESGVDKSYISKRRIPNIIKFIEECNNKLERLWKSHTHVVSGRKLSKLQLEKELAKYKTLLAKEKDKNLSEAITNGLMHEISKSSESLLNEIAELKVQNADFRETIASLRLKLRKESMTVV